MKIILTAIGTQGDIEPLLAIGRILKDKGHQVICAFSEHFRELAVYNELEFASLGSRLYELHLTKAGKIVMGEGKGYKKFLAFLKIAIKTKGPNKEKESKLHQLIIQENPDRVLYNSKTTCPIIWEHDNRGKTIFLSPFPYLHYVEGHSMLVFRKNFGKFFNKLTFGIYFSGTATAALSIKKMLKIDGKIKRSELKRQVQGRKFIYTISPALFQRPEYWDNQVKVLGHHSSKKYADWEPDKVLVEFIERNEKILFITFGSMTNPEPEQKTATFLEILERNNIAAIINTAEGGLVKPESTTSEKIHFTSKVPYDWVFPKMYAVIHHGGSGTTHLAVKHGCASMIIPHFIDQFIWDDIITDLDLGPRGMKVSKLSRKKLEPKILELMNNQRFKDKSLEMAEQMKKEDFVDELIQTITE